jgi:hypothetical protein
MSGQDVDGRDVVRAYHDATSHGGAHDRSQLIDFRPLDPTNRPDPFKRYPGLALEPISGDDPLGRVLFYGAGVTRRSGDSFFRTAMSAGNLHPVEVYVVGQDLSVRHYAPLEHALTALRPGSLSLSGAAAPAFALTGIPWRTCWKYGERGWRHLYWDAGAIAANLLYVGDAGNAAHAVHLDFDDEGLCRLLGLDGTSEFPLAVVGSLPPVPSDLPALNLKVAPISSRPIEFPLVTAVQRATSPLFGRLPVYSNEKRPENVEDVILRRGSTRLFRQEEVPESAFREPMDAAVDGAPLLEHFVAPHAVAGLDPAPRDITQHLCYDQPLGGDSAYTVFHSTELDEVLDRLGPRGYRAATFEAGLAAGRLQLAAFSIGLGATGLTFYDDEVREVFETTASCLLVTAVGVPAYRSRRGGGPGHPTELTGFDDLMGRLQLRMMQARSRPGS